MEVDKRNVVKPPLNGEEPVMDYSHMTLAQLQELDTGVPIVVEKANTHAAIEESILKYGEPGSNEL